MRVGLADLPLILILSVYIQIFLVIYTDFVLDQSGRSGLRLLLI